MKLIDLVGQKFGRLLVISYAGKSGWHCYCDCGNKTITKASNLKSGWSKSCGCLSIENFIKREVTHGLSYSPVYSIYAGMLQRCYNKNNSAFKNYGGRGIKICDRWLESFENFYEDFGYKYEPDLTIERENNDKDYEPGNCLWIAKNLQSRNRRNTIWIETEKGKMTITEAANLAGVSWFCMYNRFQRNCPINRLLLPANKAGRSFTNAES